MPYSTFPLQRLSGAVTEQDVLRSIVFNIADYLFALPVKAVLKILVCPPISGKMDNGIGMLELGAETISVVDLRHKLITHQQFLPANTKRFLILLQTVSKEMCGLIVDGAPILSDLPLNTVRPVPLSYRQVGELTFVSHMAILPQTEGREPLKIFLLAMNQLLAQKLGWHQELMGNEPKPLESRGRFLRVAIGEKANGLLPLSHVREVINILPQEIEPTPALPRQIVGLYNWHGSMLRIIDLENLFGFDSLLSHSWYRQNPVAIVIELNSQLVGFLVRQVYELEWQDLQQVQPLPPELSHWQVKNYLHGIFPQNRWLLDLTAIAQKLQWQNY